MPNIFKSFLRPSVDKYVFPDAESLQVEKPAPVIPEPVAEEPPPPDHPAPEETPPPEKEKAEDGAAAALAFARVQADEILADARRQAEQILEEARQKGREEAEAARTDAHDEGYRLGYGEGMEKARIEASAQLDAQLRQEAEEFRRLTEEVSRIREELLEQAQAELCDLSVAVAEKVIHISLKSSRQVISRMIQVATEKLKRREWVHVYVGGCEAKDLAQIAPELTRALAGLSDHIKLIPMAGDEAGACIIEMPDEIIDASASTQLNNIREILRES